MKQILLVLATCLLTSCWTAHPLRCHKTTSLKVEVICVAPGENDMCMSGDIFPSQDICVNPTLRA